MEDHTMNANATTRRAVEAQPGWGPTAFTVRLDEVFEVESFLGVGWITQRTPTSVINLPIGTLDLFLELQRDNRLPRHLTVQ